DLVDPGERVVRVHVPGTDDPYDGRAALGHLHLDLTGFDPVGVERPPRTVGDAPGRREGWLLLALRHQSRHDHCRRSRWSADLVAEDHGVVGVVSRPVLAGLRARLV